MAALTRGNQPKVYSEPIVLEEEVMPQTTNEGIDIIGDVFTAPSHDMHIGELHTGYFMRCENESFRGGERDESYNPIVLLKDHYSNTDVEPVLPCGVFMVSEDNEILSYNQSTQTAIVRLTYDWVGTSPDIASSDTKLWIKRYDGILQYVEYNITLSPFTISYNRGIVITEGDSGAGLASKDNTTLISTVDGDVFSYDITTDTAVQTLLFNMGENRYVTGDILYNPITDTYIICNHITAPPYNANEMLFYITEYSNSGDIIIEHDITTLCNSEPFTKRAYGLFQSEDVLYVTLANVGSDTELNTKTDIYSITTEGIVLVNTINHVIYGASQNVSCIDVSLPLID